MIFQRSTDGGQTWQKILFVNNKTGVADLVMDPGNPNKLIAAMWEHKRDPWFFKSGGKGSGLYMTHDGGQHWKKLTGEEFMMQWFPGFEPDFMAREEEERGKRKPSKKAQLAKALGKGKGSGQREGGRGKPRRRR